MPVRPRKSTSEEPTTTVGTIRGAMKNGRIVSLPGKLSRCNEIAAATPAKTAIVTATRDTRRLVQRPCTYKSVEKNRLYHCHENSVGGRAPRYERASNERANTTRIGTS